MNLSKSCRVCAVGTVIVLLPRYRLSAPRRIAACSTHGLAGDRQSDASARGRPRNAWRAARGAVPCLPPVAHHCPLPRRLPSQEAPPDALDDVLAGQEGELADDLRACTAGARLSAGVLARPPFPLPRARLSLARHGTPSVSGSSRACASCSREQRACRASARERGETGTCRRWASFRRSTLTSACSTRSPRPAWQQAIA